MNNYLFVNEIIPGKNYHVLMIEIENIPFSMPTMFWLCEDREEYSEYKVNTACIKAFPAFLDVMACETAVYKYTWLQDEIETYRDNIQLYRNMLGVSETV